MLSINAKLLIYGTTLVHLQGKLAKDNTWWCGKLFFLQCRKLFLHCMRKHLILFQVQPLTTMDFPIHVACDEVDNTKSESKSKKVKSDGAKIQPVPDEGNL